MKIIEYCLNFNRLFVNTNILQDSYCSFLVSYLIYVSAYQSGLNMDSLPVNELLNIPPFSLSDNQYVNPSFRFNNGIPLLCLSGINLLDDILIYSSSIFIEFKFPYAFTSTYEIESPKGHFSKRDIIDLLRSRFSMHFKSSPNPAFVWERSLINNSSSKTTDYHVNYPYSGMFASFLSYNSSSRTVSANVECYPFVDYQVNLPF